MFYEKEIYRFLALSGNDGLRLTKLSRHVFNALNSFFNPLEFQDIQKTVASFVVKKAKDKNSIIERTSQGLYRLNPDSVETQQLMLQLDFDSNEISSNNDKNETTETMSDEILLPFDE